KFRGPAHSRCNLKLQIDPETIKILVLFCNGSSYNFHHLMQEIAKVTDKKIVPIANNSEQYITFSVGQLQFIDKIQHELRKRWEIQVLKSYKLKLEKDEKIKKALKQYLDDEELQGYMEYGMKLKYYTKLLETAKKQVKIER
ncbi:13662_t:CDS:2, partial [Dentiscutata heterogama]